MNPEFKTSHQPWAKDFYENPGESVSVPATSSTKSECNIDQAKRSPCLICESLSELTYPPIKQFICPKCRIWLEHWESDRPATLPLNSGKKVDYP